MPLIKSNGPSKRSKWTAHVHYVFVWAFGDLLVRMRLPLLLRVRCTRLWTSSELKQQTNLPAKRESAASQLRGNGRVWLVVVKVIKGSFSRRGKRSNSRRKRKIEMSWPSGAQVLALLLATVAQLCEGVSIVGQQQAGGMQSQQQLVGRFAPPSRKAIVADHLRLSSSREVEKQIVDRILGQGYDRRIRPAGSLQYSNSSSEGKSHARELALSLNASIRLTSCF